MATYIIGYDLNKTGQNYNDLIEAIKSLGEWWHCLDSTWIIKTDQTITQVRDSLSTRMDANDQLLVAELSGKAAWAGFSEECSSWLTSNL